MWSDVTSMFCREFDPNSQTYSLELLCRPKPNTHLQMPWKLFHRVKGDSTLDLNPPPSPDLVSARGVSFQFFFLADKLVELGYGQKLEEPRPVQPVTPTPIPTTNHRSSNSSPSPSNSSPTPSSSSSSYGSAHSSASPSPELIAPTDEANDVNRTEVKQN